MTKETLTAKQKAFCEEYLKDLNAQDAAIRAGYAPESAKVQGCRLLKTNPAVKAYVDELKDARSERTAIDADYVLSQLGDMQQALVSEILTDHGNLKDVSEWPEVWQRMVVGVDVYEEFEGKGKDKRLVGYTKRVRLMDRTRVLQMLGQHVKVNAFNNEVDVNIKGSLGERLLNSRRRLKNDESSD